MKKMIVHFAMGRSTNMQEDVENVLERNQVKVDVGENLIVNGRRRERLKEEGIIEESTNNQKMNKEIQKGILELREEIRTDYIEITTKFRALMLQIDSYLEYLESSVKGGNEEE